MKALPSFLATNRRTLSLGIFSLAFAIVGVTLLLSSSALTPTTQLQPEQGTVTAPATIVSDSGASGGSAIKFNSVTSPSGQAMPVGDLPGWKQVFTEDFTSGNVPVGSFPGSYGTKWSVGYGDNVPDTGGKNGRPSMYMPSKVLSINNGVMNMFLHSENGKSLGAAPMPKVNKQTWPYNGQLYGKWTARFKSEPIAGFKTAWLLWPDTGVWDEGEIDFPEGGLDGNIHAFSHCANVGRPNNNCISGTSPSTYTSWHTASIEWIPGRVTFILDGQVLATGTSNTPNTSMHYVMQTESCFAGLNDCPAANATANLQVDWVSIYTYNP